MEGQLEARMNIEEEFETAKVQLKAQFDDELVVSCFRSIVIHCFDMNL